MKVKSGIHSLILAFLVASCVSPPDNFPSTPEISFSRVTYLELDGASDSLKVAVDFKDAEGDLGLDPGEVNPPYNPYDYVLDDSGDRITYSNRPSSSPSYSPKDWEVVRDLATNDIIDTFLVSRNDNYYNIFIQFFVKRGGNFNELDLSGPPYYANFNGRFPKVLNDDNQRSVEGTIEYAMLSSGWRSVFRNDTIRIDVQLQDRMLNRSNKVSSPEFTLNQILQP